jgi:hypothetical protein
MGKREREKPKTKTRSERVRTLLHRSRRRWGAERQVGDANCRREGGHKRRKVWFPNERSPTGEERQIDIQCIGSMDS